MRLLHLLVLSAACLFLSCSGEGETKCQGSDVEAVDNIQGDGVGDLVSPDTTPLDTTPLDTTPMDTFEAELADPECVGDGDCAGLVDSPCQVATCSDGSCVVEDATDGTLCDDGNGCTQTDTCQAGFCTGANPVVCPVPDQCHDTGICDPATGTCSNPAEIDGTLCDDGNAATGGDTCQGGLCLGEGCVCNAFGPCCDGCYARNEAGPCNDGDQCTQTDLCESGFCVGSDPVVCEATDQCHEVGACDPSDGTCSDPEKVDSTPCDDGDARTIADECVAGICTGTPCTCDTTDTCCDGCLGINQGAKCWEGTQYGGLCTSDGLCHDPSRWAVVVLATIGISVIDTMHDVVYGPFLNGWLGSANGGRFDVAVSPDGTTAVVSNFGDSTIHFIDMTNPTEPLPLGTVIMPMFAEDVTFTPDGKFVLVTDGGFSESIVVVDSASRTLVEDFREPGLYANSVSVGPDGTVLVVDYFAGKVHALTIDDQGHLTLMGSYAVFIDINGEATLDKGKHMIRPVNLFIAPDGKTVLVPDVTKYNETPTMVDPVIDTGYAYFALVVFEIVAPGVLELKGSVKKVPAVAQSLAFSDDGRNVYVLGNGMMFRSQLKSEFLPLEDHLVVLDIAESGEIRVNTKVMPSLKRSSASQLFGVDGVAVSRGKAYVTHSVLNGATSNVTVVDLGTFEVNRLLVEDYPLGIAVVPMNDFDAPFVPGPASCEGICGSMNQGAHCGCDEACHDWSDCCSDVAVHCQGCDSETCDGWNRVCEMLPNGTYGCGCRWGFTYLASGVCADIDECALGIDNCIEGAWCQNQDGSFWCNCPAPMVWDSFGSCLCPVGFVGDMESGCSDIDECADGTGPCKEGATCVNRDGGYDCECDAPFYSDGMDGCHCPDGFALVGADECIDIDECAEGDGPCKEGAECVNEPGYYQCLCQAPMISDGWDGCECPWGFTPDGTGGCTEIDECANEPCDDTAICVDQVGYYECICELPKESDGWFGCFCGLGYAPDGEGGCVEIDECASEPCHDGATCVDYLGYFECQCAAPMVPDGMNGCQCPWGYTSDGAGGCVEIDECEGNPCGAGATCVDHVGHFECICEPPLQWDGWSGCVCQEGYTSDGAGGCLDINECDFGPCDGSAVCVNHEGYYQCTCEWPMQPDGGAGCMCASGYRSDGLGGCVDIDECAEGTHGCWESETCINEIGGYWCW